MKKITTFILLCLLLCSTKNYACSFSLNSQNVNQVVRIGTTDTLFAGRLISDSCGGNTISVTTNYGGNLPDTCIKNPKLYRNSQYMGQLILVQGLAITTNLITPIPPNDTSIWTIIGTIDSTAPIGQNFFLSVEFTVIDSGATVHLLNSVPGIVVTTTGSILRVQKNPLVLDSAESPGIRKLFSMKVASKGNDTFQCPYLVINNIESCPDSMITNMQAYWKNNLVGSMIPQLGTNTVFLFPMTLVGNDSALLEIFGTISSNVIDSSKIKLKCKFNFTSQQNGFIFIDDSLGQTTTILNPTSGGGNGPCDIQIAHVPSSQYIYTGSTEWLGRFSLKAVNCDYTITGNKVEVTGTGLVSHLLNGETYTSTGVYGNLIPVMSYVNNFSGIYVLQTGMKDTFDIVIDVANNTTILSTYQATVTVTGFDENNNQFQKVIVLDEKTVLSNPTGTQTIMGTDIRVFPNPTTGSLNINNLKNSTEVILRDMLGKVVLETRVENGVIDITHLRDGLYFLKIENIPGVVKIQKK